MSRFNCFTNILATMAGIIPPNPSLVLYQATVDIRSNLHGETRSGSGALVRIENRAYIATNFHVIGRFLENHAPAYRQNLTMRHMSQNVAIQFGNGRALAEAFIEENGQPVGDYQSRFDAVLIDIPNNNATYLPFSLDVQSCTFQQIMGSVVHGFGCKLGTVKFFSGEVCSQLISDTFCVSSNSTEKGLSGAACTINNVCIGIIQRGTSGRDDPVFVPNGQTVRTLATYATDQLVTALFHHSKLTYIVSSSVLLSIHAGIVGGSHAPELSTLTVATVGVQDLQESVASSSDDEEEDFEVVRVRHARRNTGGMAAITAGPVATVVHNHNHYACCNIS